jgi:hypothetical protein
MLVYIRRTDACLNRLVHLAQKKTAYKRTDLTIETKGNVLLDIIKKERAFYWTRGRYKV